MLFTSLWKLGGFDVYNIETTLPSIDPEFYEQHLKAIRDDERRVSIAISHLFSIVIQWQIAKKKMGEGIFVDPHSYAYTVFCLAMENAP